MLYDCIIIGAGASGLFCSAAFPSERAAGSDNGAQCRAFRGLVLEKTSRPGTKLLMSGGGQCNITHAGSVRDFIPKYGKNGSRFRSCLYRHSNLELMDFLHENGISTVIREDGKVFPASMNARQILDMLLARTEANGFQLICGSEAAKIRRRDDGLFQIRTDGTGRSAGASYLCRNLVIASGGCSYPSTGSDGSFFRVIRRDLDMDVTELRPALTPVNVTGYPYAALAGIALQNVHLSVFSADTGRKKAEASGSLLFTHENFSGPLVLNLSKEITKGDRIVLNYIYPDDRTCALDRISLACRNSRMRLHNLLPEVFCLPRSFLQAVISRTGEKPKAIASLLTEDSFSVESLTGFHKAMVTSGGVSLSEVNPKTMECVRFPGIYVIGEALDIDGETGGYNLQFAYSSAKSAADAIAGSLIQEESFYE
ncbi:MAG: NAD(P)/FAD-dependent oxidoreductase [Emergencia sp.]